MANSYSKSFLHLAITSLLSLCIAPCQAMSDDQVLEQSVIRLEQIQIKDHTSQAFEQYFFWGWYGRDVDFGLTPGGWGEPKRAALNASAVDKSRKYKDKDLQRFLTEYEHIKARYAADLERFPSTQLGLVKENLSWWYTPEKSQQLAKMLDELNKKTGWNKHILYLDQATRLFGLARLVLQIAPDRFLAADLNALKDLEPLNTNNHYSDNMLVQEHSVLDFLIHSDVLRGIVPADFDLDGLRKLDTEIHSQWNETDNAQTFDALRDMSKAIYTLDNGVIWNAATSSSQSLQAAAKVEIPRKLQLLGARLKLTADKSDHCKSIRPLFNDASLRLRSTEWKKMQLADGSPVMQSPKAMEELVNGYSMGCFTPNRDTVAARRLLEEWADQHGDHGKLAGLTHCKLAGWYRYGIGGKKDLKQSSAWEQKAKAQAEATCDFDDISLPPVDPADPWRELR